MSDRKKLMALRDASVDARRKAALGLDMGDPSSLETLTRTHLLITALDAVIDELPPHTDVEELNGYSLRWCHSSSRRPRRNAATSESALCFAAH
jgi:hypothetical protein